MDSEKGRNAAGYEEVVTIDVESVTINPPNTMNSEKVNNESQQPSPSKPTAAKNRRIRTFANSVHRASGAVDSTSAPDLEKSVTSTVLTLFEYSHGLTTEEATNLLAIHGRNELPEKIVPKW